MADFEKELKALVTAANPPAGYVHESAGAPFSIHNGPIFTRQNGDQIERGFRVSAHHLNGMGTLHGGMMMAFADNLLGHVTGAEVLAPTLSTELTAKFISMVRPGQWVDGRGIVLDVTGDIIRARAELSVGPRIFFEAEGSFTIMRRHQKRYMEKKARRDEAED